jgi:O-antigen/teichoic acid export membrane protein
MKNPLLKFALIRLGLFIGGTLLAYLITQDAIFSAFVGAAVGLAISLLFFNKHRSALSESIYNAINNKKRNEDESVEDASDSEAK